MIRNFKILIEYDGTDFHGWQYQPGTLTIQGEIQRVLEKMTVQPVFVNGSGRTDAGVHALGQTANFKCDTALSPEVFLKGLNSLLPDAISIRECVEVDTDFHARFDARGKTYQYRLLNRSTRSAVGRQYAWHIFRQLDIDAMREAAGMLCGKHDFKSFEGAGSPRPHTVRKVTKTTLVKKGDVIEFEISGNGFLKHMVRNIMGTLVDAGLSKISPPDVKKILEGRDRRLAGPTAPPHGLFLRHVDY